MRKTRKITIHGCSESNSLNIVGKNINLGSDKPGSSLIFLTE